MAEIVEHDLCFFMFDRLLFLRIYVFTVILSNVVTSGAFPNFFADGSHILFKNTMRLNDALVRRTLKC